MLAMLCNMAHAMSQALSGAPCNPQAFQTLKSSL